MATFRFAAEYLSLPGRPEGVFRIKCLRAMSRLPMFKISPTVPDLSSLSGVVA